MTFLNGSWAFQIGFHSDQVEGQEGSQLAGKVGSSLLLLLGLSFSSDRQDKDLENV